MSGNVEYEFTCMFTAPAPQFVNLPAEVRIKEAQPAVPGHQVYVIHAFQPNNRPRGDVVNGLVPLTFTIDHASQKLFQMNPTVGMKCLCGSFSNFK